VKVAKKAFIDQELYISCGLCTDDQPKIFHMNDEDKPEAITDDLNDDLLGKGKEAVDNCPVEAIRIK
jgi:ferredoxin